MSIAPSKRLTAHDLLETPDGDQFEQVDGRLAETTMSMEARWIAGQILFRLNEFLAAAPRGIAVGEGATCQCFPDDPEMVHKPDVSFIRDGRLPREQFEHGHCRIAPDLAVEVVLPNDLHADLTRKLEDCFSAGIPVVRAVEPEQRLVTIIEIATPGNKRSRSSVESFVKKAVEFLRAKINLPVIDLFPPTSRDPNGLRQRIWEPIENQPFELPADKPLTLATNSSGGVITAYIEPVAAGDVLPDMAVFSTPCSHVPAPLAAAYELTWNVCPKPLKNAVLFAAL